MKRYRHALGLFVLALMFHSYAPVLESKALAANPGVIGWINFKPVRNDSGLVKLRAEAISSSNISGRFFFSIRRNGPEGVVHSNQSGTFHAGRGRLLLLFETVLEIPQNGIFQAHLQLIVKGRVVFSTVLDNNL